MGIDWQTKCAPAWQRTWDKGRKDISQPTLFTQQTPEVERTFRARPAENFQFVADTEHQLRVENQMILILDGVNTVGRIENASQEVLRRISEDGHCIALGVVRQVYKHSKSADILIM